VFWTNIQSMHQAAFIRALAVASDIEVIYAYEEDVPEERLASGWYIPDFGRAQVVDARRPGALQSLCRLTAPSACHCFGTFFHLEHANAALGRLRGVPCRRIWVSEAFDLQGWRGLIRMARLSSLIGLKASRAFHGVLAMGRLGVDCFVRGGMPPERVREFAYLTDVAPMSVVDLPAEPRQATPTGVLELLFVGQLIARKGGDLLISALADLTDLAWRLTIIGDGPERRRLESLARQLGLASRVEFAGAQSNAAALAWMRRSDCLVLPSRFDGWGAVVNEALLAGTNVIVSDRCGSAALVDAMGGGSVVPASQCGALHQALRATLTAGPPDRARRATTAQNAARALDPAALAGYFLRSIEFDSGGPRPPWREHRP
jgi:glycosyltransferase involved in cell wall biosynthesis